MVMEALRPLRGDDLIDDVFVGEQIKMGRQLVKWTQEEFAEAVSTLIGTTITQEVVCRWEKGKGLKPSILQACRIASGQPLRFYYGGEGTTKPEPGNSDFRPGPVVEEDGDNCNALAGQL